MPEGVEHLKQQKDLSSPSNDFSSDAGRRWAQPGTGRCKSIILMIFPLMPEGVEHIVYSIKGTYIYPNDFSSDAGRRWAHMGGEYSTLSYKWFFLWCRKALSTYRTCHYRCSWNCQWFFLWCRKALSTFNSFRGKRNGNYDFSSDAGRRWALSTVAGNKNTNIMIFPLMPEGVEHKERKV